MIRLTMSVCIGLATAATAAAQPASASASRGYVEVVAHSAFGNVTSQSYGVEAGATVNNGLQVFGEVGRVKNVATTGLSASAQQIAGALTQVQSAAVGYSVREPVTFYGGGVRYQFVLPQSKMVPYVQGGFGVATVTKEVSFQLGGVDATPASLAPYVTIGGDLSGDFTKPMLIVGGGVVVPVWQRLIADLQYRFGRIFEETTPINVNRVGLGIGVRF